MKNKFPKLLINYAVIKNKRKLFQIAEFSQGKKKAHQQKWIRKISHVRTKL